MLHRAKFIWTPQQVIDPEVTFRSLLVHGPKRREDGCNRWVLFRRAFELPEDAAGAQLRITADSAYLLFVNGERVARGPARGAADFLRLDCHDVRRRLRRGTNVIAVLVHVYGVDTAWYELRRDYAQALFGDGALYVEACISCGGQSVELISDASWRVMESSAWRADVPRSGWGQGFIEDHDARLMPDGWTAAGFDDSAWEWARVLLHEAQDQDLAKGWGDIEPISTLLPSDIPPLAETDLYPVKIVAIHEVVPQPELAVDRRVYEEQFIAAPVDRVQDVAALLRDDNTAAVLRTDADRDVCVLLQFERRHSGYPFIELDAAGGEIIEVAVAETIPGEYSPNGPVATRVARESYLECAHVFRYTARAGRQAFRKFDWTAVKYLQLVVRNAPKGVRVLRAGSTYTHYPVTSEGHFECSDTLLTRLWDVGCYTTLQCTHDAWEDCPGREKRQWLGDGIVHYLIDAAAFGPGSQPIDRRFLLQAIESQRPDGLLQMFAPGDHHSGGIVIPDFNLHWICAAHHYLMHTGDQATVGQLLPAVQRSLDWFERQTGPHGLLVNVPHWHFIEWARVGRQGESFTINAMLVGALAAAAGLAQSVGYTALGERYLEWAAKARQALRERHYDASRGIFVDSVDPLSGYRDPQVSQQANAMAILFDIADQDERAAIIEYIMDEQRLRRTATPPVTFDADPFDAATDVVRVNTYYCHFLYSALGKARRFDLALEHIRACYGPMLETGTETLWESFEPVASLCHAFSATAVHQLSAHVLGVTPAAPGFKLARIAPQLGDLDYAQGVYPTALGPIEVHWRLSDARTITLQVAIPEGIQASVEPPESHQLSGSPTMLSSGRHELKLVPRS